jgi:hypothetical protein
VKGTSHLYNQKILLETNLLKRNKSLPPLWRTAETEKREKGERERKGRERRWMERSQVKPQFDNGLSGLILLNAKMAVAGQFGCNDRETACTLRIGFVMGVRPGD